MIKDLKPVTHITSWGKEHRKIISSMNMGLFIVTRGLVPTGKQGVTKLMVKHQYQDPEEEIQFTTHMGHTKLSPKVYNVVCFWVWDKKSSKMNKIYALIMEQMDRSLINLQPFQPHNIEQLVSQVMRIYLDLMLKYQIQQLDPKPTNFLFNMTPQNGYHIILRDYSIAKDIKEEHFNTKNMKKFINYNMLNMFIGAYTDKDKAHKRHPAEVNYGLVYKTLKKAIGQAHMVINRFF